LLLRSNPLEITYTNTTLMSFTIRKSPPIPDSKLLERAVSK